MAVSPELGPRQGTLRTWVGRVDGIDAAGTCNRNGWVSGKASKLPIFKAVVSHGEVFSLEGEALHEVDTVNTRGFKAILLQKISRPFLDLPQPLLIATEPHKSNLNALWYAKLPVSGFV